VAGRRAVLVGLRPCCACLVALRPAGWPLGCARGAGCARLPGQDVVAGFERVQARNCVQQRCGRIDGNGVNGLSKQLGLMPFVGGDQCGVVADRRVAFLLRLGPAARSETVAFMSVEQMMTLDEFGSQNGSQRLQLPGYAEPTTSESRPS